MIHVIDLFAGPGGLGEGFSAFRTPEGESPFRVELSVEREPSAHATLMLRSFLRQFGDGEWPEDYWEYLRGGIDKSELYSRWEEQHQRARLDTLGGPTTLGEHNTRINKRLNELVRSWKDEPAVVIGGPPCQAYSLVGRSRNRGKQGYRMEEDERSFLYRQYLRVLSRVKPAVFVMENVRGMLSARVSGELIFPRILDDLRRPGRAAGTRGARDLEYTVFSLVSDKEDLSPEDYLIRSEQYGVPQARHRVILLGVRSDLGAVPETLKKARRAVGVGQVISRLPPLRSRLSRGTDSGEAWKAEIDGAARVLARPAHGLPPRVRRALSEMRRKLDHRLQPASDNYPNGYPRFDASVPRNLRDWLAGHARVLVGHVTRGHMPADLHRYFFAACWARAHDGRSPRAHEFPAVLAPEHANWHSGKFADRFCVQSAEYPAKTITSHISKDGHYYIHPDPAQCRSLTPREAARLQTFPDDYHFEGNRTQQFVQIGNAVPPWLARQIAEVVYRLLVKRA